MIAPRQVGAWRGAYWISAGFQLVFRSPFGWIKAMSLWFAVALICSLILFVGPLLFALLLPVLFAGLMVGCQAVEQGGSLQATHLLAGFRLQPQRLIQLGGANLLGEILLTLIITLWGTAPLEALQNLDSQADAAQQLHQILLSLSPLLVGVSLVQSAVLMMGWFAPALIVFERVSTLQALQLSARACAINLLPFLVYSVAAGLLLAVLVLTALMVPLLAGVLLLMGVPTLVAAVYVSYREIFPDPLELEPSSWSSIQG